MGKFDKKTVVVTGGASGIGAAIAQAFVDQGARVTVLDIAAPSGTSNYQACDVSNEASVEQAFDRIERDSDAVDIVVHSAAVLGGSGPFQTLSLAAWQRYIDINLTGAFLVSRAAATRMIKADRKGRIIFIGSVNSFAAERHAAPYVASKGGVRLLTRAAAVDLAQFGITVNMIAPGPITTPATRSNFATDETKEVFARSLPGGHPGTPNDIAAAALFFAAPDSAFITGTDLLVDGGMFAQILS